MTVCLTLDLEPDFGRRVPTAHTAWDDERVDRLIACLAQRSVPLTVFVVAESAIAHPEIVEKFKKGGAEFHLHSFSHDLHNPDTVEEIRRGRQAFERCFGHSPTGYRAPEGRISPEGWRALEREGFLFDASVFPSFWPRPRYLLYPRQPFQVCDGRLLAVPLATLSAARLIVSVSWINLLGWPFYEWLLSRSDRPNPFVFDMHLHDLWTTPSAGQLQVPWRWVYARNCEFGLSALVRFLDFMKAQGERFETLGAVVNRIRDNRASC